MENIAKLIIQEDKDFYVCHKPAGVLSQADRGFSEDMVSALMTREKMGGNKNPFIAPINRLDRPVEGLILFARNSKAAGLLTKQITGGDVDKNYYALVELTGYSSSQETKNAEGMAAGISITEGDTGTLRDYLVKDAKNNTSSVVVSGTEGAKEAVLEYTVLQVKDDKALLKVKLHTGRHHQIRVQLSHAGMPLVGDTKYNPALRDAKGWTNIALCSCELSFTHPVTKKELHFTTKPRSLAFAGWSVE